MNIGGGEAADQVVRMMLSSGEVAVRLTGSAIQNLAAIGLALAQNNKKLSGRTSLGKMLQETRDIRVFPMSREQYQVFRQTARPMKVLYAAVKDKENPQAPIDLMVPSTELERANQIFQRMGYGLSQTAPSKEAPAPKKESRSGRDSPDTKPRSSSSSRTATGRTTPDRRSVLERLTTFREQLAQAKKAPTKQKERFKAPRRDR